MKPPPTSVVAWFQSGRFEAVDGEPVVTVAQGEPCCVRLEACFNSAVDDPVFAISLRNDLGHAAFSTNTAMHQAATGHFGAGETSVVRLRFENCLAPGRYTVMASITRDGAGSEIFDVREDLCSIIVHATETGGGIVDLPHTFEFGRVL